MSPAPPERLRATDPDDDSVSFHRLVMIVRFHCGYMAYNPPFHHLLTEINVLLATMGEILRRLASGFPHGRERNKEESTWNEASARALAARADVIFHETGLQHALEDRRSRLSSLQNGLTSLSSLSDRKETFEERVERFQTRGAQSSEVRQRSIASAIVAIGSPNSEERQAQMEALRSDPKIGRDAVSQMVAKAESNTLIFALRDVSLYGLPASGTTDNINTPYLSKRETWEHWILSRKSGIAYVEALRAAGQEVELAKVRCIAFIICTGIYR